MALGERLKLLMSVGHESRAIRLFGDPACVVAGVARRIGGPPRTLTLLLFLVLHRRSPLERRRVAFTLWPDVTEEEAAANLRRHLHALSGTLPEGVSWLTTTRVSVAWNTPPNTFVDVVAFEAALDAGDDEAAVLLYTGPLCPAIDEEWASLERDRLANRAFDALDRLMTRDRNVAPQRAIEWAMSALRVDPWRESTIRTLMELRVLAGDRAGARREYQEFAVRLQREYDATPDAETTAIYERIGTDVGRAPRLKATLPHESTSLIGRERELVALSALLIENRLVTLKATGGVGKTRLAIRAARDSAGSYADGVMLVQLAGVHDGSSVIFAALDALETLVEGGSSPTDALIAQLGERNVLLVLDNCEQVIVAVATLAATILERCPNVRILCTSREALNISGEHIYEVLPLGESDAVELFVARAQAVAPQFEATPAARKQTAVLAQRLDGIPLAIELAAARMRAMTLPELDRRLDDRFRVLTGGNRIALPRQQSMRALIEWSVALLTDDERVLFRRLAVFNGDFTSLMVSEICAEQPLDAASIFEVLLALVDKSLVSVALSTDEQRYRLFDSTRAFAREELSTVGESAVFHAAHLGFFEARAHAARHGYEGPDWPQQCAWIKANYANFRAALAWGLGEQKDIERGTRLATGLLEYWHDYGLYQPALQWLEIAHERADALSLPTRAQMFYALGTVQYDVHSRALAQASLATAVALYETLEGFEIELAVARNDLALLLPSDAEHFERKRELFGASLATYERIGNATQRTVSGINLASLEILCENLTAADRTLTDVLTSEHDVEQNPTLYSSYFRVAAYASYLLGKFDVARAQMTRSVDLGRPFGETVPWAARVAFLGLCEWQCDDRAQAVADLTTSIRILRAGAFSPAAIQALFCYGRVLAETDDLRDAVVLMEVARRLTHERGALSPLGMQLSWFDDRARNVLGQRGLVEALEVAGGIGYEAGLSLAASAFAPYARLPQDGAVSALAPAGS